MSYWSWWRWTRGGDAYADRTAQWALQEAYAQRERADSYARACAEWAARMTAGGAITEPPPVPPPAPEIGAPARGHATDAAVYGASPLVAADLERMREANRRTWEALDAAYERGGFVGAASVVAAAVGEAGQAAAAAAFAALCGAGPRPMTATEVLERITAPGRGGGARRRYAADSGDPGAACDYRPEWAVPLAPVRPK